MEINEMNLEQIETRKAEIEALLNDENADLDALQTEIEALEQRKADIKVEIENRKSLIDAVIKNGVETAKVEERKKEMSNLEVRNTKAYIDAYKTFVLTGKDDECRALLTENVTGTVPVPVYLEDRIRTAWDKSDILSRVRRSAFRGNLKVGVELAGDPAQIHTEGGNAITEENLTLYIAELVPETIKKMVKVSDEVLDADGEAFLDYLYDEIEYRIVKKAEDLVVADIKALATSGTAAPIRGDVAQAGINDILNAFALLSDEASNPVVIMNKQAYAYYKGLANAASYAVDPFLGMPVLFNDTLVNPTATGIVAIVGDLNGVQCNFPNGYQPTFKYDDLSLAESDLVKIVGRLPMGHAVVATRHFATITKA